MNLSNRSSNPRADEAGQHSRFAHGVRVRPADEAVYGAIRGVVIGSGLTFKRGRDGAWAPVEVLDVRWDHNGSVVRLRGLEHYVLEAV